MKHVLNCCCLATLLFLTAGCVSFSQYRPIQGTTSSGASTDSATVTIFLLERDIPTTIERVGTVTIHTYGSIYSIHQRVETELQKLGREKGANGAYRVQHGTYDHEHDGIVSYLLFRYKK
ncbi:hypothetical protein [Fibrella arboris]|uniref:hypothetical protein n=1 Tax=Fibrella arboris TaxID=3242486 RepID=UPI003522C83B